MKKLLFTLLLAAGSIAGWAEKYPTALYVVGNATEFDWGPGSDPEDAPALTKTSEKVYEGFINFDEANGELKFLVTNKYNQGQWGPNSKGTSITSTEANLYYESIGNDSDGHPDNKFKFNLETGLYLVKVDLATEGSEKVTFKKWESSSVYEIGNLGQLKFFANRLNTDGVSLNAKLIADIGSADGDKMDYAVGWDNGSSHQWYTGEFNGDGHTIYLNIDKSGDANPNYQGLFGVATNGANIHDLIIKGSVKGKQYVAGVLGAAKTGHIQMTNVINAAEITATKTDGYPDAAGLVGTVNGSTYITLTRCGNAGDIISSRNHCAALCGWSNKSGANKSTYTNCWNIGTISYVEGTGAAGTAAQLYRNSGDDIASSSNCFDASATTERSQGTLLSAGAGASGELCYRLNGLSVTSLNWYQTLGTDNYPVPFSSHGEMALSQNEGWYEISEPWQLRWMAEAVNTKNDTYKSAQIKLINDIDYTAYTTQAAMIGKATKTYKGTFDGLFHTVTVAFNNTSEETGLVQRMNGGTIKNLKVDGTITTSNKLAAGICSGIWETGTITNCWSNVTINDNGTDNATHGGIVAHIKNNTNVTIANCLFSGHIKAENRTGSGALVGWADNENDNVKINHCLVVGEIDLKSGSDNDLVCRRNATTSDNYYTCDISNVNNNRGATDASSYENGKLCYLLNGSTSGGTNWTQTIGTDTYPIPFNTSMLVFKNGSEYDNIEKDGDVYKISNANELKLFSSKVNNDGSTALNAKLTNDIDMSGVNDYTPIGTATYLYSGTFDGDTHRIKNLVINKNIKEQGLFSVCTNATIKNLIMDASCSIKSTYSAWGNAAFVAVCNGSGTLTFENCGNEASVEGTSGNNAAFLGKNYSSGTGLKTVLTNCYNTGAIKGGGYNAALVGESNGKEVTTTNCYNKGTVERNDGGNTTWINGSGTKNITNCYTTLSGAELGGLTQSYSEGGISNGELCYLLNKSTCYDVKWTQTIGEDSHPIPFNTHGIVNKISSVGYTTQYIGTTDVTIPDGVEAYAGVINGNWLSLREIEGSIHKNDAVVLKGTANAYYSFVPTSGAERYDGNELHGSDGNVSGGSGIYALANKSEGVGFYPVSSEVTIPAGRAYLSGVAGVKGFTFVFDDTEDGIKTLSNSPLKGENIYNLAGQRVSRMQKGINIINGKKVLY